MSSLRFILPSATYFGYWSGVPCAGTRPTINPVALGTAALTANDDFQSHSLSRCRDPDFPLRTLNLFPANYAD
jgi:hypothetical protein